MCESLFYTVIDTRNMVSNQKIGLNAVTVPHQLNRTVLTVAMGIQVGIETPMGSPTYSMLRDKQWFHS